VDVQTLRIHHPLCDARTFRRYNALYMGGKAFRAMLPDFLPKQPNDTDAAYQLRCKVAAYRSYVGQIVRSYAGTLFASHYAIRVSRDGDPVDIEPFYASMKEDCDGQGTDLTSFFKDRFRQSLVCCASYWLVEMPRHTADELGMTQDEFVAQRHDRPRLRALDPLQVIDWEADNEGGFAWVKTHQRAIRREDPSSPSMVVETWRVYFDDRVDVYELSYKPDNEPKPETTVPLVESYAHGCARVPILSMRLPDGLWLLDAAADAQVEHFQLSAALGWALRRCAYPLGVFKLQQGAEPPKTGAGLGVIIGTEESFAWAEPSGTSLTQLREEIKAQKDEIFRVAQQMASSADSSASAMGRSGLSKLADAEATNACLRDYATIVREAIEATLELISNARGDYALTFSIEGLSTFSTQDIESIIEAATSAKEFGIEAESDTYRIEAHTRIAALVLAPDTSQETKDAIRDEIRQSKPKDLGNGSAKPQNVPGVPGKPTAKAEPTPA